MVLTLPFTRNPIIYGNLVEDERVKASYDIASGEILMQIPKETPGEDFPDLDLLTKLLAPRKIKVPEKPSIEVVGEINDTGDLNDDLMKRLVENFENNSEQNKVFDKPLIQEVIDKSDDPETQKLRKLIEEAGSYDWELPQQIPDEKDILPMTASYGFNGLYSGYFTHVQETCNEIIDITDVESSTLESRRRDRIKAENVKFDPDHYIADFMGVQDIKHLIKYKTNWTKLLKRIQQINKNNANMEDDKNLCDTPIAITQSKSASITTNDENNKDSDNILKFTEKETLMMMNLPNKSYLIQNTDAIYFGLVDLLYAYSYNHRVYEGEITVESAWTIGKLSPTISCLEEFNSLEETIIALFRRSLAYPWYRNFELLEKCLDDVYVLLKLGRRAILKVLLELKDIFDHHDIYYTYSKIWLDDYCIWCQTKANDKVIRLLAHNVHHFKVPKSKMGWHLEEYEQLALEDQCEN